MIKITQEINLEDFQPWAGAVYYFSCFSTKQLEEIDRWINELYPEGIDETMLNDLFWFDSDELANVVGFDSFGDMLMESDDED